ncbi:MAG TPA: flagellar hook-length control protein FliK [Accumulibacter sp.]|uniref:flagellar hook-length control protein FliK n=1 Tax=Accumulibacter sp. TaxID=2053492 RepID=UPI002878F216|nr:flagellar hook-length control protein FliK [Accumulibacter sp.]MDS4055317.1 flagellar hook-length control protein FliK [Accumulibacter sp.]HMV05106.1 flagellar hook-length control protein FliK [Accumulibacter sp.]HNC27603.1 flagellar hook-length control protein FliK [Accumulibacter sp.]HNH92213.1 flagellar hook-length control protein FliK [Accumulibacter sp.]HNI51339.1 flagellar hook-length control protein FliK [Accumulibacter sp.]
MIRSDLANRIGTPADLPLRSALPAQDITDKLPGLVAGQRLLAQIEALLPNGTYRAVISQRSVTLALPFAAKSGDAIELEVAESNGRLTLAVVARSGSSATTEAGDASFTTKLSRTGQLIGDLFSGAPEGRRRAALPLNENRPLAMGPPASGRDLLPVLEKAIVASGMFYEAHQAEWVEGRFSKAQLLLEPQGRLSPQHTPLPAGAPPSAEARTPAASDAGQRSPPTVAPPSGRIDEAGPQVTAAASATTTAPTAGTPASTPADVVAPPALAVVQQQLEAFATQVFTWQGQVWPGQQLHWQIEDPVHDRASGENAGDGNEQWQTRLRLTLPRLGEVEARLGVQREQIALSIIAPEAATRQLLSGTASDLRGALERAGLSLASFGIGAPAERPAHAQDAG